MDEGVEKGKWEYFYSNGQLKKVGEWKDGLKDGKWEHYSDNGNKTDFVLFSKGKVWMVLEFDRFGVVKVMRGNKFNEMLKNKSSIEASETRKGRRKLRKQKAKEKKKLNKSKKQKGDQEKSESK